MLSLIRPPQQPERSPRDLLIASFTEASHGKLESLTVRHQDALLNDPLLYVHLSRWYQQHGTLRDHHQLFAAHLLGSSDAEFRAHAMVLLQTLRPYQVARVVRYSKEVLHHSSRALRSAVKFYLQRREADPLWFDECVLRDRRSMKYLYATLHLKPGARAEAVLFRDNPPADSRLRAVRKLHALRFDTPAQAMLIRRYRIQFTTAMGAIRSLTPDVLLALIDVMTPQQLMNNLVFLERRGALNQREARQAIFAKIRQGATESRVHDTKSFVALRHLQPDAELRSVLMEMSEQRMRARGRLTVPTALLVDKSGSMDICIDVGKMMAAMISSLADAPLYVEAFDAHSFTIAPSQRDLAGWEQAFRHIRACGATSIGAPLHKLRRSEVRQILLISDGEENTQPLFCEEVLAYERQHGYRPKVFWLKIGSGTTSLEHDAERRGIALQTLPFHGDYYNLPNLVPMLCQQQEEESLVQQVLDCPLYTRADLDQLPPGFDPDTFEIL